jgi:hypothetical protein
MMMMMMMMMIIIIIIIIIMAKGWMIGVQGFNSWQGLGTFLFTTVSRPALQPTQPSIQWVLRTLSLKIKQPECEAVYEGVSKSFWTGHLEQELQMVQLSATRCSCIAIL